MIISKPSMFMSPRFKKPGLLQDPKKDNATDAKWAVAAFILCLLLGIIFWGTIIYTLWL